MSELSTPMSRKLAHTRNIVCHGYERADGLWDIEASLEDTKTSDVNHLINGCPRLAGEPLHSMKIRLTVDNELLIHSAEAVTINAPFKPCGDPPALFAQLKGIHLGHGWKKQVAEIMGGTKGCTHLRELLNVVATMAYQTVHSTENFYQRVMSGETKPFYLGTCHAYRLDGSVVKEIYPDAYQPKTK